MPNLPPFIAASFIFAVNAAMLASIGLEALGLGANDVHTLGTTIFWAQKYSAVLRGQWWWFGPLIAMIATIFIGMFFVSVRSRPVREPPPAAADVTSNDAGAADAVLRVEDLQVHYTTPRGPVKAVNGVSFSLRSGERLGLIGESGSARRPWGPPDAADPAAWADRGRQRLPERPRPARRPGARAAQHPHARDRAGAAGRDELAEPCHAHPRTDPGRHRRPRGEIPRADRADRVDQALGRVGLPVALADRFPHELSGGQKQRVAIAIATILSPSVIVADEPTSALDVVQRQVIVTLGRVQEGLGAAVILIGHDMGLVAQFADTIGVLYAGALVEYGPIDDVLDNPQHPYTRLLIESLPSLEAKRELRGIPGLPPPCSICRPAARSRRAAHRCSSRAPSRRRCSAKRRRPPRGLPPVRADSGQRSAISARNSYPVDL